MSITVTTSCDFTKTFQFLNNIESFKRKTLMSILQKYGEIGVEQLRKNTPIDTGETASLWRYKIEESNGTATLSFINDAQNDGIPVVILLQYGHGTGTGGYVPPRDIVNPAMRPVFQKIAEDAWKEVRAL